MDISVVGLGKLGLCTATCFASRGLKVVGYDKAEELVMMLKDRKCYIDEVDLEEKLLKALDQEYLTPSNSLDYCVRITNRTYIIVPTPSGKDGRFSNEYVYDVLEKMVPALRAKKDYHVVNVVSTVMPGSCNDFVHYLEKETGKKCGEDFGLTYNPEFIAIGSVMHDFMNPDMVLIGASDTKAFTTISTDYLSVNTKYVNNMSLRSAEITKLSLNYFLALKISFANELAAICEHIPGVNVDHITMAIGQDTRVGERLLRPGLGFAGPCLPRDNVAFGKFASDYSYTSKLSEATLKINEDVINRIVQKISCQRCDVVDIIGMSYKSGTKLTEGSQSILLRDRLAEGGYEVRTFDKTPSYKLMKDPDAIVLMSDSIEMPYVSTRKNILFIDPWRRFPELSDHLMYYGMGKF